MPTHTCLIYSSCHAGNALWLDGSQQQCLVLWHTTQQWASIIADWARSLAIDITTVDEISGGDEAHGTGRPGCGVLDSGDGV